MSPTATSRLKLKARWLKIVLPFVVIAVVIAFVALRPIAVSLHEVTADTVRAEVMGTGTLAARVNVALGPKIQGRLAEVLVDQNDVVHPGQPLVRLDDGELRQQVEIAHATLAAARATVDRVRTDRDRAEAVAKLTRLDHQRSTELLATKSLSQSDFDKTLQSLRVAEADLARTQFAIIEAERQVAAAEKNLLYQQERLSDTRLLSPLEGLVVKRNRNPGDIVVPGSDVLDLVATDGIWVSAWVDETAISQLAPGQSARVVFRSEPMHPYTGEVARLGRQTDPETREFLVDVRLSALPTNWTIGQRAEVFIATGQATARATVPVAALQFHLGHPGVFVAEGNHARWRPVQLGLRGHRRVEITRGLAPGEQVATPLDPRAILADGVRIAAP